MKPFLPVSAVAARCGLALAWAVLCSALPLLAQNPSDACSAAIGNRFVVDAPCRAFNKPASFVYNHNPGGCNAGNYDDAYGNFVGTGGLVTVRYTPSGNTDAVLHVLSGCTGPVLGCSDAGGANGPENVTIPTTLGTVYYVRVQRYGSNSAMNGTLCLFSADCLYTLNLYDSYGDGWGDLGGTAYVEVIVGGVSQGLWTLNNGYSGTVNFGVTEGQTVQVIYNTTGFGWYLDENSMELTAGGQCLYSTSAPPNIGLAYAVVADCNPSSSALPEDCVGGATLCSNQNINSNSTTTGCFIDLNASNRGCLQGNERQGTWYYFSPSTSGTLGFSLVPNGNIDYDFALWGPYAAAQCPNNAPVRCSWANGLNTPTYSTGMGNGATDVSEDQYGDGWVRTLNVTAGSVYVLYVDNYSATGQDFTLTWNLTNGASLDCTTLPVELLDLQATPRDRVIDVTWSTATERNADRFEVQRSPDNADFTTLGSVAAAGDAQFRNDYSFTDVQPFTGANYYRLRQVDRDGTAELSHTVVAFMGGAAQDRPVLFPNPVGDELHVAFRTPLDGSALLFLQDALGRQVSERALVLVRGDRTATLATAGLASGWYHLRIGLPNGQVMEGGGFLKQ